MTPKDFAAALIELSRLTGTREIELLASIFTQSPEKTMAATLKKMAVLEGMGACPITGLLDKAGSFARSVGAAKFAGLLGAFASIVAAHGTADAHAYTASAIALLNAPKSTKKKATIAARPDVVRAFVKRLEESLGDEGFAIPYRDLESNKAVTNAEVVAIARTFTSKKPASRPKALQAIWARHHALLVSQAKSESRGGRSAA